MDEFQESSNLKNDTGVRTAGECEPKKWYVRPGYTAQRVKHFRTPMDIRNFIKVPPCHALQIYIPDVHSRHTHQTHTPDIHTRHALQTYTAEANFLIDV